MSLRDPKIRISLFSRADMSAVGDAVLAALVEDPLLGPDRFGDDEPYRLPFPSDEARQLWQSEARKKFGSPGGTRRRPVYVSFLGTFGVYSERPFHVFTWDANPKILELPQALERIEALFRRLAIAFQSHYGFAGHSKDFERQNVLPEIHHPDGHITPYLIVGYDPHKAIPGLHWLNYFGPDYLSPFFLRPELLGQLNPPAEPLGAGIFLKLASSPLDMLRPEVIERTENIKRRLGEDLFFDIQHPDRPTRAPAVPIPGTMRASDPPPQPVIRNASAFIARAAERAQAWHARHGLTLAARPTFEQARQALRLVERELSHGPDLGGEDMVADATAVLGELILRRIGGHWAVDELDPYVITGRGEAVYPLDRVLKRAHDDVQAHLYPWFHDLVQGTLPLPQRPQQV